jgi:hypothetical protein
MPPSSTSLLLLAHNLLPSQRSPPPQTRLSLLEVLALLLLFPIDSDDCSCNTDRDRENGIQSSAWLLEQAWQES